MIPLWGMLALWWLLVIALRPPIHVAPHIVIATALGYMPWIGTAEPVNENETVGIGVPEADLDDGGDIRRDEEALADLVADDAVRTFAPS